MVTRGSARGTRRSGGSRSVTVVGHSYFGNQVASGVEELIYRLNEQTNKHPSCYTRGGLTHIFTGGDWFGNLGPRNGGKVGIFGRSQRLSKQKLCLLCTGILNVMLLNSTYYCLNIPLPKFTNVYINSEKKQLRPPCRDWLLVTRRSTRRSLRSPPSFLTR